MPDTVPASLSRHLQEALQAQGWSAETVSALASNLLWRLGRTVERSGEDGPVTVRLGFATSAARFADLPRLKSASDAEIEAAVKEGSLRVEWVGER